MKNQAIHHVFVAVLAGAALVAAGCASGPRVRAERDKTVDFSQYETFAFVSPLGTDREGYQTMVSQYLKAATQRELEARGLRLVENSPQLLVNFSGRLNDRLLARAAPETGLLVGVGVAHDYYRYRTGFYTTWPLYPMDSRVDTYTEGTLNVDMIDAARKQMVWEGVAVGRVTEKTMDNLKPKIDEAITAIFAKYPVSRRVEDRKY
jgi:hypothetical protein